MVSQIFTCVVNNPAIPIITVGILFKGTTINGWLYVDENQFMDLSAVVTNDPSAQGVRWSVDVGSLTNPTSSSVTYGAPSSVPAAGQNALLTATSIEDGRVSNSVPLALTPSLAFTTSSVPDAYIGSYYNQTLVATGGTRARTLSTSGTLPPGLNWGRTVTDLRTQVAIQGVPTGPTQSYNIGVTISDASDAGQETATANLSINVQPPQALSMSASPLPIGGAGISYNAQITASGGIPPYTFALDSSSDPLPSGLALTTSSTPDSQGLNPGVISGFPTSASTTNNLVFTVSDSQSFPATASGTYNLTINPSTGYFGVQTPGRAYQVAEVSKPNGSGMMNFEDQGTNGLTGPIGPGASGSFTPVSSGFNDLALPAFGDTFSNYFLGFAGEVLLLTPAMVTRAGSSQVPFIYVTPGTLIAAAQNSCPQLPVPAYFQFVTLPDLNFDNTQPAHGFVTITQTASNSFDFAFNSFTLDGSTTGSSTAANVACDSDLRIFTIPGATKNSTIGISSSGVLMIDNGNGVPAVGLLQPAANLSEAAILGGQYLGFVSYPNNRTVTSCWAYRSCATYLGPQTDAVGFGPGTSASITGGTYANIDTDAFSAHANDRAIALGAQTSPGLFPGSTLTLGSRTLQSFDVVVGQVNGKYVLIGIALDDTVSPVQPYMLLLIQQQELAVL